MEAQGAASGPFSGDPRKATSVKVAVRCRIPLEHEIGKNTFEKLVVDGTSRAVSAWNERTNAYKTAKFDIAIDQDCPQGKVFELTGMYNIVKHVADGYHATVFAYGQTGSGKTYTMEGYKYKTLQEGKAPQAQFECGENEGVVPRCIRLLFDLIKQQSNLQKKKFTVYCSYLQVYKERIYDLLNKSHVKGVVSDGPGLKLKWNKNDVFSVENLYTFECKTVDDVMALYHFGIKNKVVASHNMNNSSSRSHSMLSLTVEQVDTSNLDNVVVSKLQLVDLAGSERQSQTGNVASKESIDINKSLFTLRQVITALTERHSAGGKSSYIPYRDSKLTCLLRQSLGGNSYCLMIACLNPCDAQIEENISTMQYASQASYISNKPVRNDDPKARQIELLKEQVRRLTEELAKATETIDFLSKLTNENPQNLKANFEANSRDPGGQASEDSVGLPEIKVALSAQGPRPDSAGSAVTEKRGRAAKDGQSASRRESSRQSRESSLVEHRQIITQRIVKDQEKVDKFFREKADQLKSIASYQRTQNPHQPHSAANESKDAITERIVHTVNMMKEVLQGNMSLREEIQRQSEGLDDRNAEIFQLSQENDDLRERLAVLEEYTGKDSLEEVQRLVREKRALENRVKHLEQTNNNWTQLQKTRDNFHKKMHTQMLRSGQKWPSQERGKATLDNEFNDDFEPVRPQMGGGEQFAADQFSDEAEPYPAGYAMSSHPAMRSNGSHQRVGYDQATGQKVFRVTTNNPKTTKHLNILNKQRSNVATSSKQRNQRAPLPNAHQATDRSKASRQTHGGTNRVSSKVRTAKPTQQSHIGGGSEQMMGQQSKGRQRGPGGPGGADYQVAHVNSQSMFASHGAGAHRVAQQQDRTRTANLTAYDDDDLEEDAFEVNAAGRARAQDLNLTVDNPGSSGKLQMNGQKPLQAFTHGRMTNPAAPGGFIRGAPGSTEQGIRKQASSVVDPSHDEPSQPLMPQAHQLVHSPDIGQRHDLYDDMSQPHSPTTGDVKISRDSDQRPPAHMAKTSPHPVAKLPPRSPAKYANAQQPAALRQRQQLEHQQLQEDAHLDDSLPMASEDGKLSHGGQHTGPTRGSQDASSAAQDQGLRERRDSQEREFADDSGYYDEEDEHEIEAEVRELRQALPVDR